MFYWYSVIVTMVLPQNLESDGIMLLSRLFMFKIAVATHSFFYHAIFRTLEIFPWRIFVGFFSFYFLFNWNKSKSPFLFLFLFKFCQLHYLKLFQYIPHSEAESFFCFSYCFVCMHVCACTNTYKDSLLSHFCSWHVHCTWFHGSTVCFGQPVNQ